MTTSSEWWITNDPVDPVEDPAEAMHGITAQQGHKGLDKGQRHRHKACKMTSTVNNLQQREK